MPLVLKTFFFYLLGFAFLNALHADQGFDTVKQNTEQKISERDLAAPVIALLPIYEVSIQKDIPFGKALRHTDWNSEESEEMDLLLDIYQSKSIEGKQPVIFLFYGGGFEEGSKEDEAIIESARFFAARGFLAIVPNYRIAGDYGTLPEPMFDALQKWPSFMKKDRDAFFAMYPAARDAKAAVRWLYANAEQLNADTKAITALGYSAGALLSVVLGTTDDERFRDEISTELDKTLPANHLTYPSSIHTIINRWGGPLALDMQRIFFDHYPYDPDDAPMQMVHGTLDTRVPFTEALRLAFNYEINDVYYELHPLHWVGHDASNETLYDLTHDELALLFIIRMQQLSNL